MKKLRPNRNPQTGNRRSCRAAGWLAGVSACALAVLLAGAAQAESQVPFLITVDGQPVSGSTLPPTAGTDDVDALDVQIKFDGLGVTPMLNVSTVPPRASFRAGDEVNFLASFNYAAWIARAEIIIYERGRLSGREEYLRIPVTPDGAATWTMPGDAPAEMLYVLRVYDADGRYDETVPLPLNRVAHDFATHDKGEAATAPGYSEDRTAIRNIDIAGGAVTVYGKNVPEGHNVYVAGEQVPVDSDGSFVVQRVYPSGSHEVSVTVEKDGQGLDFTRSVEIPENEWFYVGLADFTAGYRWGDHIEEVREGEFGDDVYTRGRLAFYVKGKIKGKYILTAAADTSEKKLKSIFKGLDEKDPRQFLKRIDPDDYYPVYGDDSTFVEDAPTQGKFYIKLQRGPSHVMWGNFKANITGSKFVRTERALYGAQGVYRSGGAAPDGGYKTSLDVHAALPGTLPNRDNFRGTGGSAYFLRHQDVTPGSDTVTIEVRNSVTGWVLERRTLRYGEDYDLDYVQGVLILRTPLPSSSAVGTENYLVVNYEFTPATEDVDGYVLGGRAQQWFGDHLRAGVTGLKEKTGAADQLIYGADIHVRHSEGTYLEAEVARSEGPGFSSTYSPDGGLTNQVNPSAGIAHKTANAYRVEAHSDLEEMTDGALKGNFAARYEHYQKGFSSLDVDAAYWRRLWGVETDVNIAEKTDLNISYSDEKQGNGTHERQGLGKLRFRAGEHVVIEPFVRHTKRDTGAAAPVTSQQGERTETGVKLSYEWDEDNIAYVFGQGTVQRTGTMFRDDRVGIGGKRRLAEKLSAEGEVSEGSQGFGASFLLNYEPTSDDRYYIGYTLDPLRDIADSWPLKLVGEDAGTIVAGARKRFNDQWKAYGEDSYDMFGKRRSLTQAYGVTYTPDATWTINGAAEIGHVFDDTIDPGTGLKNPDFDRKAFSVAASYKDEDGVSGSLKGEWRHDDSEDSSRELYAYLLQARLAIQASEDWRAIGSLDVVISDSTTTTRDSEYAEGSIGFAYRPTTSDRFNALLKYTYLYDNPGGDQVGVDGTTASPAQQTHIVSADAIYQLTPQLSLGAKYGFRIGELRERIAGADWEKSEAHLAVLRADLHVVHNWDALLEGRILWSPTTDQTDLGAIAAVYRHFGENFKVGIGYNFGKFSDDLRDLVHDDQGIFLNMIGKF
jgi:hypothetical protein